MAKRNMISLKPKMDLLKEIETKKLKQADVTSQYNISQRNI